MEKKMSLIESIQKKCFGYGKGVSEPPPEKGIKRFGFLVWNHFWKLVTLNVLFLVFSIPVITMPAALCGMNRVLIKLVQEGNCFLWDAFITEFKANLLKSIPFGILFVFLLFDSYYCLSWSISTEGGISILIGAIGIFLLVFAVLLSSYVFVFLPTLALKNRHILKNACLFSVLEWKTDGIILISLIVVIAIVFLGFPITLLLFGLGGISIYQLAICTAIYEPLKRRIFDPYEKQKSKSA